MVLTGHGGGQLTGDTKRVLRRKGEAVSVGRFCAMVGALLRRPSDGKYLVLRRSEEKDFGGGEWECVTGRVDQGESFGEALLREVREEIGIEAQPEFILGTTHFFRGEETAENEMLGVLYCCAPVGTSAPTPSWEHAQLRWVSATEVAAVLQEGHWLRDAIERAEGLRALQPQALLDFYRQYGFEV